MSKPIKKPMFKWSDKAKKDAVDKFHREAQRLLKGGVLLEDLKEAIDRATVADITNS
jgi:hypothetical protein